MSLKPSPTWLAGCMFLVAAPADAQGTPPVRADGNAGSVQFIDDDLTGASSHYRWIAINGACLTAGNVALPIPGCAGLPYYRSKKNGRGAQVQVGGMRGRLPDPPGAGALRLTNGDERADGDNGDMQSGAVMSEFVFPTVEGVDIVFTSVTYGGDGMNGTGADGMSFFLADGAEPPTVGATGGALGYSCSNNKAEPDGVAGAYLGIGIDEFGNFSNRNDVTSSGPYFVPNPNHIVVRGAGDVSWNSLSRRYPRLYPAWLRGSERQAAVRRACETGFAHDHSRYVRGNATAIPLQNYRFLTAQRVPEQIATAQGRSHPTRGEARPITYAIKLTQDGRLSMRYSYNGGDAVPVLDDYDIVAQNGPLPPTLRFGFAASTGLGSNVHEITCFRATPDTQSQSSATAGPPPASRVDTGPQVYFSFFDERFWTGRVTAHGVVRRANGSVDLEARPRWDAACGLTGGDCPGTGAGGPALAPSARAMVTWNGVRGVPFQWQSLAPAQQAALSGASRRAATRAATGAVTGTVTGAASSGARIVAYLRGERGDEVGAGAGGTLRKRKGMLGDIVRSSPAWVGAPTAPYDAPWRDALHGKLPGPEPDGSYAAFARQHAGRQHVVYIGANDGLLHAFRAGGADAGSAGAHTYNDGREILAYMPSAVGAAIRGVTPAYDLVSPQYVHNLYVDATAGSGDLFHGGAWHTWVVGGLGGGARPDGPRADDTHAAAGMIYVLDATDPARFEARNAASVVLGEWSSARLDSEALCNVAPCGARLGMVYGTPLIRRLHNGKWAVLFGNGYNSAHGTAGLFVMLVDPAQGAAGATFHVLDTGVGPAHDPAGRQRRNGIAQVTAADLDGDHITDYVYAGDLFGNVWRFDLTDADPARWHVSPAPVYATQGAPISTRILVSAMPAEGGGARVMLHFGTGRQMDRTVAAPGAYAPGQHALYGVWDAAFEGWNARAGAAHRYAALPAPRTLVADDLLPQTTRTLVTGTGTGPALRQVSTRDVCWQRSARCAAVQYGWRLPLPAPREQIVHDPGLIGDMLVVNTTIPPTEASRLSCAAPDSTGYTMAIRLDTGGAARRSFFDLAGTAVAGPDVISGVGLDATGAPTVVTWQDRTFIAQQTVKGVGKLTEIRLAQGGKGSRINWMKLR